MDFVVLGGYKALRSMRVMDANESSAGHMTVAELDVIPSKDASKYQFLFTWTRQGQNSGIPLPVAQTIALLPC